MENNAKTGCIVQARTTSTRLPGKVLKTLDYKTGTTILEEVIRRLKLSGRIDEIVIATTVNDADDEIVAMAEENQVQYFRGSEEDVLSRYFFAAKEYEMDHIIRVTSDCPFIDPYVIDDLAELYFSGGYDYVSNGQHRTYPHGLDCEICSAAALEKAFREGQDRFYREHVTTYIYHHPDLFSLGSLELTDEDYSDIRITVDTMQDYVLACVIRDGLTEDEISFRNILKLYQQKPFLRMINGDVLQKKRYETIDDELEAAAVLLRLQEMNQAADIVDRERKCLNTQK